MNDLNELNADERLFWETLKRTAVKLGFDEDSARVAWAYYHSLYSNGDYVKL